MTVWIYARTADPDSNALTGQAQDLADYAARHGWQVAGFTLDHGRGSSPLRPPLWAMLWKLRSGKADAVLVRSLNSFIWCFAVCRTAASACAPLNRIYSWNCISSGWSIVWPTALS